MRASDIAVAVMWVIFIAGAISSGIRMGRAVGPLGSHPPFPPTNAAIFMLILFFVASSAGVFLLRRRQSRPSWIGRLIDRVWGEGAWASYNARLRPIALMIVTCFTLGIVGLASTYAGSQSWTAYFNCAFVLTVGSGLAIAYALSRKYPPTLN